MKRQSTKDTILYTLKKCDELSIKELMPYFTISEAAVRKQLGELVRFQFVQERMMKQDIGRPYYLYTLTDKGHRTFPNQYETLPTEILSDLETSQGQEMVDLLLKARKERETKELMEETTAQGFEERIQQLITYQEDRGYMVDMMETDEGDIEIINYNCPIYNLASNYNVICSHEKEMYRDIFPDSTVISHNSLAKDGKCCKWTITNPDK